MKTLTPIALASTEQSAIYFRSCVQQYKKKENKFANDFAPTKVVFIVILAARSQNIFRV